MIQDEIKKRILILDGAMGTAIQQYGLTEADFRGSEFISHPVNLKGNNDILNLTCPEVIRQIHRSYIEAGADIIETNTFNSNAISQAEYRGEKLVYRLNYAGAKLAVTEARAASHQVYVAGSMGPTSKTLSLSPDVNRPEFPGLLIALKKKREINGLHSSPTTNLIRFCVQYFVQCEAMILMPINRFG